MTTYPKVTIAFISWNRLHYLKAAIESARLCIDYPNLEWILSDNESIEPGFREYTKTLGWFDKIIAKTQTHPEAMNQIIEEATGEYVIIWPDDVQFVVQGKWLQEIVDVLERNKDLGSVCLDFMRRSTLEKIFRPHWWRDAEYRIQELRSRRGRLRPHRTCVSPNGYSLLTMGWMRPGVVGSGIPSLTATRVWKELGPWKVKGSRAEIGLVDSSLGAEDDMLQRVERNRSDLQRAAPLIPVAADIITDPLGCKAKVRSGYRYGVYMPPPDGLFYYKVRSLTDIRPDYDGLPLDFNAGAEALGFHIPVDRNGERKKTDMNTSVVFDIAGDTYVEYPLAHQGLVVD